MIAPWLIKKHMTLQERFNKLFKVQRFSVERMRALKAIHGIDLEEEITAMLDVEIKTEKKL